MPRLLLGLAVIVVVVTIYAVVDCAMMSNARVRGLPKPVWIVIIIVLPVIGLILWFLIGRGRKNQAVATGPRAPDDDPAFLGRLGRDAEQDDRIRRLEEELAALDSESADPDRPAGDDTIADRPTGTSEVRPAESSDGPVDGSVDGSADQGADRQDGDARDR